MTFGNLNEKYNDNLIGFLAQGPDTAFLYWELSDSQQEILTEMEGYYIRLYQVNEDNFFNFDYQLVTEVKLSPFTNNWYFNQLEPGLGYVADIGCKLPEGDYFSLIKSGRITTPPEPQEEFIFKRNNVLREKSEPVTGLVPADENGGATQTDLKTAAVFSTMPFYMGYHL